MNHQKDSNQKSHSFSNRTSLISSCSTNGVSRGWDVALVTAPYPSCRTYSLHDTTYRAQRIRCRTLTREFRFKLWNSLPDLNWQGDIIQQVGNQGAYEKKTTKKTHRTHLFNLPLSSIAMKCRVWRRNMFVLPLWETSILLDDTEGQWKWKGIPLRAERWSQNCAIKFQYRSRRISRRIHHNVLQFTMGSVYFTSVQKDFESPNIP